MVGRKREVDVALGEVACSKNEGPHSLCKVRATSQCATSPMTGEVLSLASCFNRCHFKNGRSEEKEVDVVLGEVACSKIEGPPFLCKVRATNHCATAPSIASPHAKAKVPLLKPRWSEAKEVDVALGEAVCSKNEGHILFVKFALLANVQLLQRRVRFLA